MAIILFLRSSFLFIVLILFGGFDLFCQDQAITWIMEMEMPPDQYQNLKRKSAREFDFVPANMSVNEIPLEVKEMHSRGKTTLQFWRKSYSVKLGNSFKFMGSTAKEMDHFYLISMSLDRYYYHNQLAFECLSRLGLFPLWYHLTELKINGATEGLYLIVQRPADYALKELGADAVIRRKSSEFIAKEKYGKKAGEEIRKKCRDNFNLIRKAGKHWRGAELYDSLNAHLVLDHYFAWLSFNYFVQNGDYTDELFYYMQPTSSSPLFEIIPWDFDDILVKTPHEGEEIREVRLDDQLLFSSEDELDLLIARDSFLYTRYLEQFDFVFDALNPDTLDDVFGQIKARLKPYLVQEEIVAVSKHDFRPVENWQAVYDHMDRILRFLKDRWMKTRVEVKKQLRKYKK